MKLTWLLRRSVLLYLENSESLVSLFFHNLPSVKPHGELQKNQQPQQAKLFKCHKLMFHFLNVVSKFIFWKILSSHIEWKIDCCNCCSIRWTNRVAKSFLINKHLITNTYCWSLAIIYWLHITVNCICAKSLCPQKSNNIMLILVGCLQHQCFCI